MVSVPEATMRDKGVPVMELLNTHVLTAVVL